MAGELQLCFPQMEKHAFHPPKIYAAHIVEPNMPTHTVKMVDAQLFFQLCNRDTQGGLRYVQLSCCTGYTFLVCYGTKILQLCQFHRQHLFEECYKSHLWMPIVLYI